MHIINYILIIFTVLFIGYFAFSYLPYIFKKKDTIESSTKLNKYLILIPSRNESKVLKRIVDSILDQTYNHDYYDYVILLNNSNDDSKKIIDKYNIKYLEINNCHNKGDVLRYAFNYYKDYDYLGYIIFDTDNKLDKEFLINLNDYYNKYKYDLIQGLRLGLNTDKNYLTGCYELYYIMQNVGFNELKVKQNQNGTTNGTGFFISRKYINKYGYNTSTITEDIELNILASLNHKIIGYSEKSITYDEYVDNMKTSIIQRKRWSRGMIDCFKYLKRLLIDFIKNKNINSLNNICILIGTFFWFPLILNWILLIYFNIKLLIIIILLCYLGLLIYNFVLVKRSGYNIRFSSILFYPIFMFTFFYVQVLALIKKDRTWQEIKHGK